MSIYIDPADWWIGYYRGPNHHYVCPLPSVVIRWPRRTRGESSRAPADGRREPRALVVFRAEVEGVDRLVGNHEPECIGLNRDDDLAGMCDCRLIRLLVIETLKEPRADEANCTYFAGRLRAILDADPDTPAAPAHQYGDGGHATDPGQQLPDAPVDDGLVERLSGRTAQDIARNIVNQIGDALWEQMQASGVNPDAMIDARQKTNDIADEFATRLITAYAHGEVETARRDTRENTLRELADHFMHRDGPGYVVEEICSRFAENRDRAARGETGQP